MANEDITDPEELLHLPTVFTEEETPAELQEVADWYDPTRLERVRRAPARSTNALHDTFDLIGGVPRLAAWAHDNPGAFYTKLFTKTIERATKSTLSGTIKVVSAVPRTILDGHVEAEEAEFTESE